MSFFVEANHIGVQERKQVVCKKEGRPKTISIDSMCIEEQEEDKDEEHHFVEA